MCSIFTSIPRLRAPCDHNWFLFHPYAPVIYIQYYIIGFVGLYLELKKVSSVPEPSIRKLLLILYVWAAEQLPFVRIMAFAADVALHHRFVPEECIFSC